jgi:hypothetical protein
MASNEMADVLLRSEPKDVPAKLRQVGLRYARSMGISANELDAATLKAREKLVDLARAMEIKVAPGSAGERLLKVPAAAGESSKTKAMTFQAEADDTVAKHELHATQPMPADFDMTPEKDSQRVSEMLAAGIQDITNAMVEDFKLSDVLRMILETMFRAMEFRYIVFCMRDPKTDTLTGRFGLGTDVEKIVKSFHIAYKSTAPDLFAAVCSKGADTMITDAIEPRIADRLPPWYKKSVDAPTFLLLPLLLKGAPFGLIYADKGMPGGLQLGEKELALLRTLRNQAVMAFKQSS